MRSLKPILRIILRAAAAFCLAGMFSNASAQLMNLRIGTYNIEDDIGNSNFGSSSPYSTDATTPLPGLIWPYLGGTTIGGTAPGDTITNGGVLEGIGEQVLSNGIAQPFDVMCFEETSGPSTMKPIVAALNTYYSQFNPLDSNMYAVTPFQATESGGATNDGNGPNSMVYNTRTLQLIASIPVLPAGGTNALGSSSGEYREVMCYEFSPAGQTPTPATEFYIYVSHYKSGTTSTDANDRAEEAAIIRDNEATNLPAGSRVIYVGDYNVDTSAEVGYQTILALNSPNGYAQGQGFDSLNVTNNANINWESTTTNKQILAMLTEEDYDLRYRDDLQLMTSNVFFDIAGGLCYVTNTYHAFGNNGSLAYGSSVIASGNTALTNVPAGSFISAAQTFTNLTGASDHLPVVADYTIPVVQPVAAFTLAPTNTGVAPLTVTFTDASSGIVTNWNWSFGDGGTSNTYTTTNVTYAYATPGTYTATETVTGPGGTSSTSQTIIVLTAYQAWQLQYFGCTNCPQAQPNTDADGTGQSNYFKFIAGLNPTDPTSVFTFSIAATPGQSNAMNLTYNPTEAGRVYTPYFATNIAGPWSVLTTTATPSTNGTQVTLTDTNAGLVQEYYLIQIAWP